MGTNIDKLCEILKGHSEGKTIQVRDYNNTWSDIDRLHTWCIDDLIGNELRIKPEPREFWVLVYRDGSKHVLSSKKEADEWVAESSYPPDVVHCREVLENE